MKLEILVREPSGVFSKLAFHLLLEENIATWSTKHPLPMDKASVL